MDIKAYYSTSKNSHSIVFRELGVVVGISDDKFQRIEANYEDAEEVPFDATITGKLQNLTSSNEDIGITSCQMLFIVAELKSLLFE